MNEILNINNVHGYLDKETGTAYLNAEDVARGFGFTESKNGIEYVKWRRVNAYLREFGFSTIVAKYHFLPENMVYRLGFKASNEVAQKFQAVLADEVLPAIRKHGAYMTPEKIEEALLNPVSVMGGMEGIYFTFRSDLGAIADAVPRPLEVAFPFVSGYIVNINKPAFTLPYREAMLGVYVKHGDRIGLYPVSFLLSGPGAEMATLPGREKYGLPKKMCEREEDICITKEEGRVRAIARRHGIILADVSVKLDGEYNNPVAAACYEGAEDGGQSRGLSYYMHPLMEPDEDGMPAFSKVNVYSNIAETRYPSTPARQCRRRRRQWDPVCCRWLTIPQPQSPHGRKAYCVARSVRRQSRTPGRNYDNSLPLRHVPPLLKTEWPYTFWRHPPEA